MEPVSATIATALALGASAALKSTAESAVKDAYQALKTVIKTRYAAATVDSLELKPDSLPRRAAVQEELDATPAGEDADVLQKVRQLLELVAARSPQDAAGLGVDLDQIRAAAIRISDVRAQGGGVRVTNADVAGAIEISQVMAGGADGSKKKDIAPVTDSPGEAVTLINVQARTIHVGPRYEELTPAQRVEALEAAAGFRELLSLPIKRPDPPEKAKILLAYPIAGVGVVLTVLQMRDPSAFGVLFYLFPLALTLLGISGFFYYRFKIREYYAAKPQAFAACVVGKDFVSTATEASPRDGKFVVRLTTAGGVKRTVDLLLKEAVLVDVGDLGVAGVRNGRLVDFKRLSVESG